MTDTGVTLNSGSGGKTIDTEACGLSGFEIQRIKMVMGARDTDGGDVSATNPMPVYTPSSQSIATGQGTATTSSAQIVAARTGGWGTGRINLAIENNSSNPMWIGGSGVTPTNGKEVPGNSAIMWPTQAAIYAVTNTGTATFDYVEFY